MRLHLVNGIHATHTTFACLNLLLLHHHVDGFLAFVERRPALVREGRQRLDLVLVAVVLGKGASVQDEVDVVDVEVAVGAGCEEAADEQLRVLSVGSRAVMNILSEQRLLMLLCYKHHTFNMVWAFPPVKFRANAINVNTPSTRARHRGTPTKTHPQHQCKKVPTTSHRGCYVNSSGKQ